MAAGRGLLVWMALWSCVRATAADCTQSPCTLSQDSMSFYLLGDWGGLPIWPWYSYAQATVAKTVGEMAQATKADFILALGDNFYYTGVKNVNDQRFQKTFEQIYTASSLQKPWYVLAGNHDHYGNVSGEVAYSAKSSRWTFPSLYYKVQYQLGDGTRVDILMMDTVSLCGNTRSIRYTSVLEYLRAETHEPNGPEDVEAAEAQWTWLEDQLKTSTAQYLFVAGHFPVYSIAEHGPTSCLVDRLRPLLTKYQVSAYFSGHDHNLQHFQHTEGGWQSNFVLSGGGAFLDSSTKHKDSVPAGSLKFHFAGSASVFGQIGFTQGAFVRAQVDKNQGTFTYYKGNGDQLYQFSLNARNFAL